MHRIKRREPDFFGLRQGQVAGCCEHGNEPSVRIFWLTEKLLAFQEGIQCMVIVIYSS
jgi:hypothetical protein